MRQEVKTKDRDRGRYQRNRGAKNKDTGTRDRVRRQGPEKNRDKNTKDRDQRQKTLIGDQREKPEAKTRDWGITQ